MAIRHALGFEDPCFSVCNPARMSLHDVCLHVPITCLLSSAGLPVGVRPDPVTWCLPLCQGIQGVLLSVGYKMDSLFAGASLLTTLLWTLLNSGCALVGYYLTAAVIDHPMVRARASCQAALMAALIKT